MRITARERAGRIIPRRILWLVGPALLGAVGCRDAPPDAPTPGLVRLDLSAEGRPDAERLVASLRVPEGLAPWSVPEGGGEIVPLESGGASGAARALLLAGTGEHEVRIPLDLGTARIDAVSVLLRSPDDLALRVGLLCGKTIVSASDDRFYVHGAEEIQVARTFLAASDSAADPPDTLTLRLRCVYQSVELLGVDLLERPLLGPLPPVGADPELIDVGGDHRRGWGLSSRAPAVGRFRAPAGGRLAFAAGRPEGMLAGQPPASLLVHLVSPDGDQRVERLPLPESGAGWRAYDLPLDCPVGAMRTLRLELVPEGEGDAACALSQPRVFAPLPDPPTVLLVTSDTHRADHLGTADLGIEVRTPNLDALAARGIYFEHCFSSSNVTTPSHVSLMTGMHPRDTGIIDNHGQLGEEAWTLAESFSEAGYVTFAATSVLHLSQRGAGLGQGFDRMSWPSNQRIAEETIGRLLGWLPEAEGQPLFAWLHLFDAHGPYTPPDPWTREYYPADADPFDPALPEPDFPLPRWEQRVRDLRWLLAQYRGEVSYLDHELGRLLEVPRISEAVLAVTADHGECLGAQGMYWGHVSVYPDTLHVPLILSWPGAPAGRRIREGVSHVDLGRTLLDLEGLGETPFPGRDLSGPSTAGGPWEVRPRFAISSLGHAASVTVERWHLVLHLRRYARNRLLNKDFFESHRVELYDLKGDPGCQRDLVEAELDRARSMRALLIEFISKSPEGGFRRKGVHSDELQAELAALGYAADEGATAAGELFDVDCRCEHCRHFD